jgi:type VII secretion-associated serine protease mycosin
MRPAQLLVPLTVTLVAVSGCAAGGSPGRAARPAPSFSAKSSPAPEIAPAATPAVASKAAPKAPSATPPAVVTSKPSASLEATPVSAPLPVKAAIKQASWSRPDTSLKVAPAVVTGAVGVKQQVRVVRLADVKGRPVITVTTSVGPKAAAAAVQSAQQAPGSVAVSVDHRVSTLSQPQSNDTLRAQQWALTRLSAEDAWVHSTGTGVVVAVIDTGVAPVADLAGQLLSGYDWVTHTAGTHVDGNGHGTHVAGIIAAVANNQAGIAGIAPGAKILPLRVLDNNGSGYSSDVAAAVTYAADHGARVINMSLGGGYDPSLAAAVAYAESKDVVVVAAAGNSKQSGNAISYPGALPNVVAVGATTSTDAIASFSNTGSYVKVAAPGVDIESTVPNGFEYMSGTSMASPYAAGTIALARAAAPSLRTPGIVNALYSTATDRGPTGRDDQFGAGLIDPLAAVCSLVSCAAPTPAPPVKAATRVELTRPVASLQYGSSVVAQAQLRNATTGAGLPGRHLSWCSTVGTAAAKCVSVTTDSTGWIRVRFTPGSTSTVYVSFTGDSLSLPSTSAKYTVAVVPLVTLRSGHTALLVTVAPGGAPAL